MLLKVKQLHEGADYQVLESQDLQEIHLRFKVIGYIRVEKHPAIV